MSKATTANHSSICLTQRGLTPSQVLVVSALVVVFFGTLFWGISLIGQQETGCLRRVKRLTNNVLLYAEQNNGVMPQADGWADAINGAPLVRSDYVCPDLKKGESGYGLTLNSDAAASKAAEMSDPAKRPLIFDSTVLEWSSTSDISSLPRPSRHARGNSVSYCDGHVRRVPSGEQP